MSQAITKKKMANISGTEIVLNVVSGVNGISAQPGQVFDDYTVDASILNVRKHLLKSWTMKIGSGAAIVNIGLDNIYLWVLLQISFNNQRLCFNGSAAALGVLHGQPDILSGFAAKGFPLQTWHLGCLPAFSCHIQPTLLSSGRASISMARLYSSS